MNLRSVLLRVLLCVALVLNGAGPVAVHAQAADAAPAAPVALRDTAAAGVAPCAAHHSAPALQTEERAADHPILAHDGASSDCCQSAACRCPCVHATLSLPVTAVPPSLLPLGDARHDCASGRHLSPALPHLIRPPIA